MDDYGQISLPVLVPCMYPTKRGQPLSPTLGLPQKFASDRLKNHQGRRSTDALVGGATAKVPPLGLRVFCFIKFQRIV